MKKISLDTNAYSALIEGNETGSFLLTFDAHFKTIPEVLLY